jgi:MFS family permease
MLCTLGFGFLLEATGNGPSRGSPVLWICAGLGILPLVLALVSPEPRRASDAETFQWRALGVLVKPRALVLLAFGAFYAMVGYGVEINLSPFYSQELHFREGAIGGLGAARYIGRALGAALFSMIALRVGRSWILRTGLIVLAASTAAQALIAGSCQAAIAGGLFGAANGWTDAVFYVLAMEASDPRMAASTYAVFMAVTNISVAGGSIVTRLASVVGRGGHPAYRPAFLIMGAFVLLAWPAIRTLSLPPRRDELSP